MNQRMAWIKNKMKERIYQLIAIQVLILLVVFAHSVLTPRETIVWEGDDLASATLTYGYMENGVLVYDLPYFSLYNLDAVSLKLGAYAVSVVYETAPMETEALVPSEEVPYYSADCVFFRSENQPLSIKGDEIVLDAAQTRAEGLLWVVNGATIKDFTVNIYYSGEVTVAIQSICLVESLTYRMMRGALLLIFFVLADLFYLSFLKRGIDVADKKRRAVLVAAVVFACYPLISNFNITAQDYTFHLARIVSLAQELSYGQFPVRMMTNMLNGYSYANSIFYCDIFLYLPALLHNCMLPLYQCYQIYMVCVTALTAFIAYYSFGKIIRSKTIALVGTVLYLVSSYRITCVYLRSAVGEYTAMTFLPLIAAGIHAVYTKEKPRFQDWILLSVGMSGVILSHVLSTEMVVVFLLLFCVLLLKKTLRKQQLIALVKAVVTTVALTAWFVVPFLLSINAQISTFAKEGVANIQRRGIYFMQLFSVFTTATGGSLDAQAQGEMPLSLGLSLVVGLGLAIYCWIHREVWLAPGCKTSRKLYSQMAICFGLGLVACLLTTSIFPWDSLVSWLGEDIAYLLLMVQYPWRYLSIAVLLAVLSTLFALALLRTHAGGVYHIAVAALLVCVVLVNGLYYKDALNTNVTASWLVGTDLLQMNDGAGEYRLAGTDTSLFNTSEVITQTDEVAVLDYQAVQGGKYLTVTNTATEVQWVVFPVQNYANYHVYDTATLQEYEIWNGEQNNIAVDLPAGYSGTLALVYEAPFLWHMAELVSLATWLLVLFWWWHTCRAGGAGVRLGFGKLFKKTQKI